MKKISRFEKDFKATQVLFPKLSLSGKSAKGWKIAGQIDICDLEGNYWDTFSIELLFSTAYPYCVPLLYETENKILRHVDLHISKDGLCCVDMEHNLIYRSRSGISVLCYLREWVYPYLANQIYRSIEESYVSGEYLHDFAGVRQFYNERLKLAPCSAEKVLYALVHKNDTGRNVLCPCGSGKKVKICHEESIQFLKALGAAQLKRDFDDFQSFNVQSNR